MDRLRPLLDAPALWLLALDALAILAIWLVARARRADWWGALTLRILAVLGLVIPGFAIFDWYRDLAEVREWTRDLPVHTELVVERFMVNSVGLLTLGFLVLVAGIYLARRLPGTPRPSEGDSP